MQAPAQFITDPITAPISIQLIKVESGLLLLLGVIFALSTCIRPIFGYHAMISDTDDST